MADEPLATVLHIEDDEVERKLMEKAFERVDANLDLQQVPNADRAGDLLANRWLEPPLVILVDLMVPGMYGGDFLAALREDPILSGTPVFILSGSDDPDHIQSAYGHHAAGYFVKTGDPERVVRIAEFLAEYVELVELPGGR